ncbi:hypothetical protein AB8I26_000554 [Vibrio parahaemolyticus]
MSVYLHKRSKHYKVKVKLMTSETHFGAEVLLSEFCNSVILQQAVAKLGLEFVQQPVGHSMKQAIY